MSSQVKLHIQSSDYVYKIALPESIICNDRFVMNDRFIIPLSGDTHKRMGFLLSLVPHKEAINLHLDLNLL